MQTSIVTNVLLSNTEVQTACAEYIEKHGVTGATGLSDQVKFQHHKGTVSATLIMDSRKTSLECSKDSTNTASEEDTTNSQLELPLITSEVGKQIDLGDLGEAVVVSEDLNHPVHSSMMPSEESVEKSKEVEQTTSQMLSDTDSEQLKSTQEAQVQSLGKTSKNVVENSTDFDQDKMKTSPLFTT